MSTTTAAKYGDTSTAKRNALGADLRALAARAHTASEDCATIVLVDYWERNAAQLRFVAVLTICATDDYYVPMAEAWIQAGGRLLALHDQARMDQVHESRATRYFNGGTATRAGRSA